MTFGQWLAHLEDVSPWWEQAFWFGMAWAAGSVLVVAPASWLLRRARRGTVCVDCGARARPDELHWCGR